MPFREPRERREPLAAVDGARRIVRIDDDDRARARRDQLLDGVGIGIEALRLGARVVHGAAAVQHRRRRPQRIVGARNQHLVAGVQEPAQREVDELADAVAHEDVIGVDAVDAARLLLHHDGFARREDAFLVAVGLGRRQVLDHREPHRLGRAQAEQPGIADVQLDDLVALPLELMGAPGELAANLVADMLELGARLDLVEWRNTVDTFKKTCESPACLTTPRRFGQAPA